MTCIVGVLDKRNKTIVIGGDSAGVNTTTLAMEDRGDPKIFRTGPFLIGYTSSFRMGQLLMFGLDPPEHPPRMPAFEYMVGCFIPTVRLLFREGGYVSTNNEQEIGGDFLVGYLDQLFIVESDFQVGIPASGFSAVGGGSGIALGSLYSTKDHLSAHYRIKLAIEAAEQFNAGVRGPINILEMPFRESKSVGGVLL